MSVVRSEAYRAWIDGLRDQAGRARILMRGAKDIAKALDLNRNFEDHAP